MTRSQFVVIGAGLAGAATAWQLARRGFEVTLLERAEPAHPGGSSHGSARILRYAYPDPLYAELVVAARADWTDLERESARHLITTTGALDFGDRRDPYALAGVLASVGVEHELVSRESARERWPGLTFDSDVLHHPGAGVIDAQQAVLALVEQAVHHGARVESDWPVAAVESTTGGVRVVGSDDRHVDAGHAVVAAGGWLPDLLPRLPLPGALRAAFPALTVRQENVFHFPYAPGAPADWPTFVHKSAEISTYGLPGGRDASFRGQKLAEFNGGRAVRSARAATGLIDPDNRERLSAYVRGSCPGLVPESYAEATCLFTNTPSEDFVLDGTDRLTIVSACSGHGAKFAPLLGRLAADIATGGPGVARFRLRSRQTARS